MTLEIKHTLSVTIPVRDMHKRNKRYVPGYIHNIYVYNRPKLETTQKSTGKANCGILTQWNTT